MQLVARTDASSTKGPADTTSNFQAYKLSKHPDPFGSENTDNDAVQWGAWLHGFRTWLSVVNPAYEAELLEVESRCSEPCKSMSVLPDQTVTQPTTVWYFVYCVERPTASGAALDSGSAWL